MNRILIFSIVLLSIFFQACKTSKTNKAVVDNTETMHKLAVEHIDFLYFSSKAKVDYDDGNNKIGFTVNIRMKKDSIIWMSAVAPFGIEAARILVTTDSVQILNRLSNTYDAYSIDWLKTTFNADMSFANIQNMLLGNLVVPPYKTNKLNEVEGTDCVILEQKSGNISISNSISRDLKKVTALNIKESTGSDLSVVYGAFSQLDKYQFAHENTMKANVNKNGSMSTLNITVKHNKAELSTEPLNFAFNVPSKFKKG